MIPFHNTSTAIIGLCWLVFIVYWLVSAFFVKRTVWKPSIWPRIGMLAVFIVAWLLLFGRFGHLKSFDIILWPYIPAVGVICDIVAVASLALLIWARMTIGRNWSGRIVLKENHELVTSGPYRYVRHPIYTGITFLLLATAVDYGRLIGFVGCALFVAVFVWRTYREEKLMTEHFPNQYPEYKKHTKRLIPWLW